jgi:Domain of unknown function (DUF4157)
VSAARAIAARAAQGPQPVAAAPAHDAVERDAEQAGAAAARGALPTGWSFAAVPVAAPREKGPVDGRAAEAVAGPGRPLDAATRNAMEARLGLDLTGVRLHDDAHAAAATRAAGAEALTLGDDVALSTRHDPASPHSRALVGHELAHVAQQRAASVAVVQRKDGTPASAATTLTGLPVEDRKRIQVVTTQVTVPGLAEKFATTGTRTTSAFPAGVTAEFDASVDASLQHGLRNVAGSLSAGAELTPAPLPPNSTATLELDVGGKIGKGLYRFTYHAPPPAGAKKTPQPQRIVVEALGKATAPPGTKAPPPPAQGAAATPDPVAEKIKRHKLSHSYTGTDLDALRGALDQVPDAHLAVVSGLKFARDTAHPTDPKAGGNYDPKTHTITMFDKVFSASSARYKGPGTVASDEPTRAIVHEIGHALDLNALRQAGIAKDKADAAAGQLPQRFPDPEDPTGFRWENAEQKKEIDAVLKAQKDAEAGLLSARSTSGTKTIKKPDGTFVEEIGTAAKGNKFREAATKDSPKAVTAYGDTDWQEAYAEAYSLYLTSPETLKAVRPNVFAYLDQNLPK